MESDFVEEERKKPDANKDIGTKRNHNYNRNKLRKSSLGFTKFPHSLLEWIVGLKANATELKVLLGHVRQTNGFNKTSDTWSYSQMANWTNLSDRAIKKAFAELKKRRIFKAIQLPNGLVERELTIPNEQLITSTVTVMNDCSLEVVNPYSQVEEINNAPSKDITKRYKNITDLRSRRIFSIYKCKCKKLDQYTFTSKRKALIWEYLGLYGTPAVLLAIKGLANSNWHMGRDPNYLGQINNDIESVLFKSREKFEDWLEKGFALKRNVRQRDRKKIYQAGSEKPWKSGK